ncbi:MAG: carbon-nitrogen family hydrolase [Alphaproteobacteria bacterium]|uniref:Carbon-nitrogen family hydrolase n=1 Tax=Candidatus Nitrobium versatile TaxID=2884831 RepID=A0A953M235_9BACT|nr:carbon-nitrogen family hydrolase [Candidatus Nitrobium versatile]
MKIALIQMNSVWEDKRENLEKAAHFTRKASEEGCDLIVFPEMFSTGFSMNLPVVAEEGYGETPSFLSRIAKAYSINLIAGFAMVAPGDTLARNMAVVFTRQGQPTATYTKLHPFCLAGEDRHFIPGEAPSVFDIEGMPSSVFICYDLRFPEIFRMVAKEVHALFVIANWPDSRRDHWETLLKARAIENQCFVIGVNRTGTDGNRLRYPGASAIFGPAGNLILSGNETEEFLAGEIDPSDVTALRTAYPFLKDMRQWT